MTAEQIEKKKAEDAKLQKKEETSEERFTRVEICDEERNNLDRVFKLFINEQQVVERDGKHKKEHSKSIIDKGKDGGIAEYFDSKSVRSILGKLGVKEIRE